jgi:hypothetical protein
MTKPGKYLKRMSIFSALVLVVVIALFPALEQAFSANLAINGVIIATLLFGCIFVFRQVLSLTPEIEWIETYKKRDETATAVAATPRLLAPMAALMADERSSLKLSAMSMRSLLDSLASRLDEGREISRYMIGLLIFLGLLGTFWGLLSTISSIGDTIKSLTVGGGDISVMFDDLKRGLETPLSGMATAFSSSLFGLGGSLILGFLDLQAGQAQSRFYNDLEEWLSSQTKLSTASSLIVDGEGGGSANAFTTALLEQSADSLDKLSRVISRSEEGRKQVNDALMGLTEQMAALGDQIKENQGLMATVAGGQKDMQDVLKKLADNASNQSLNLDEGSKSHLRNMDVHLKSLNENSEKAGDKLVEEIRGEFKLLARTLAVLMEEKSKNG